jgi:16S rRNA (guanine527-N7)-methyltransferase
VTPAVSRETPPAPPAARELFGAGLELARSYADALATVGVERGLIGPREIVRLWERHLLNCAVASAVAPDDARVADVGSGAGLPGVVWALHRRDLDVTLIEPMARRVQFLEEAVSRLGLSNVQIARARAEEMHGDYAYDVVTARAVAPLDRLARWCLPLVRPGGVLAAFKGASAECEVIEASSTVRRLGATAVRVATYGEDVLEIPTRVVEIEVGSSDETGRERLGGDGEE